MGAKISECEITVSGEYSLLLISPDMVGLLVERVLASDKRELCIPTEEILPRGYAEYLVCVLKANSGLDVSDVRQGKNEAGIQLVYSHVAEQIGNLKANQYHCFDRARLSACPWGTQFCLSTSENFYELVKQKVTFMYALKL